ncbi:MAG: RNA polymerase sigma factor [Terracidiphilus sp.]|jgi:RNA polymerase sigma-70 factor (ECF subfamily)
MMNFQSLYEKYAPDVRRFALFLCGDRSLADDITSETFLRVWSTRGRIRELTVKSYLFTVARNVHRDLQRQSWRRAGLDDKHTDPGASAHKRLEHRQELESAIAELQKLQETDRAALLMRALDEMPYEEIAAALNITPAAARVKVHRARARLMAVRNPIREEVDFSGEKR